MDKWKIRMMMMMMKCRRDKYSQALRKIRGLQTWLGKPVQRMLKQSLYK
jgi:hypothetical protein